MVLRVTTGLPVIVNTPAANAPLTPAGNPSTSNTVAASMVAPVAPPAISYLISTILVLLHTV